MVSVLKNNAIWCEVPLHLRSSGPNLKRKIPHIIRRKSRQEFASGEKSPVRSVAFAQATNRPKCTSPLFISLVLPFVSCPVIPSHPGYFLSQPNVVFSHRLDPIPFHLNVLHGSRWMCECVHHSLPAPLRGVIVSCP
jgi:hypothetical protein